VAADRGHISPHHGFGSKVHPSTDGDDIIVNVPQHVDIAADRDDRIGDDFIFVDAQIAPDVDLRAMLASRRRRRLRRGRSLDGLVTRFL
jgi:hypothetical protein